MIHVSLFHLTTFTFCFTTQFFGCSYKRKKLQIQTGQTTSLLRRHAMENITKLIERSNYRYAFYIFFSCLPILLHQPTFLHSSHSLRFLPGKQVLDEGTIDFSNKDKASSSPLAKFVLRRPLGNLLRTSTNQPIMQPTSKPTNQPIIQ